MYAPIFTIVALVAGTASAQCENVNIQSSSDVATANSCTKIGSLMISGEDLTEVKLSSVQQISSIRVTATSTLQKVEMSKLTSASSLEINNNSGLTSASFPSLSELAGYLFISGNSPKILFSAPKLGKIGGNATFSNCTGIDVGSLKSVNNQFSLTGNAATNISLSNLETVASSLTFAANEQLTGLSLEKLTTIGGALVVANNTKLDSISFPTLANVAGGLELYVTASKIDFPALESVRGGALIQTDNKAQTCDDLKKLSAPIEGSFKCTDGSSSGGKGGKNSSSSSGSKNSTGTSSNAITTGASALPFVAAVSALAFLL
ncbi:cell wall protein Ecm33 [Entomophthora muscae]|uniref:Cell wall protein Ecm33 n=1 Tax=Entomophthora muscae TaxID=34485 RepID=A0ACC2TZP2_9FUNG|nr:cell wall protein Ecm33 [Entomophthora muscae]